MEQKILCAQANKLDLVDYLEKLGHTPTRIKNNDYWYLSPLRIEKTASFKVNRKLNVWYDHGIGKGGTLVDFGKIYHNCSVKDLLEKLENSHIVNLSFHPQKAFEKKITQAEKPNIVLKSSVEIISSFIKQYLQQRNITIELARKFCKEIDFDIHGKRFIAIGFPNNSGGYELRNQKFKGCYRPKDISLIQSNNDSKDISVFEGFFDFLSYQQIREKENLPLTNFLVLNGLSLFEKSRPVMERYNSIHLYLDRDTAGIKWTKEALKWSEKYQDKSSYYVNAKDLNEHLVNAEKQPLKEIHKRGMRL